MLADTSSMTASTGFSTSRFSCRNDGIVRRNATMQNATARNVHRKARSFLPILQAAYVFQLSQKNTIPQTTISHIGITGSSNRMHSMLFILQTPPVQTTPPPWRSKSPTRCGFATGRLRTFANTTSTMLKTNAANSSHGQSGWL